MSVNDVDYEKKIVSELKKVEINKKIYDAVVISGIDGTRINVHRNVLSASSEFFSSLFATSIPGTISNEFIIEEIEGKVLQFLVDLMYKKEIKLKKEDLEKTLVGAKKLELLKLFEASVDFVSRQINSQNFMQISLFSEFVNSQKMREDVDEFIKKNFLEVSKSKNFSKLTSEKLCQLIKSNELNVDSEEDIFNGVMSWIKFDYENREKFVPALLGLIKMSNLSTEFIKNNVRSVCDANGCHQLYVETLFSRASLYEATQKKINDSNSPQDFMAIGWNKNEQKIYLIKYSTEMNEWSSLKVISYDGYFDSGCLLNQKLYFIDREEINCYDIENLNRESFENFKKQRYSPIVTVFQGSIYVMGGKDENQESVEKWDPKTNKWSDVADMKTGRTFFGTAILYNILFSVRQYNSESDRFNATECASGSSFKTVVFNDILFVVGGYNSESGILNATECFRPQENSWENLAPMNEERAFHGVISDNRFVYAVGGLTSSSHFTNSNTIEYYDVQIDKWTFMSNSMDMPRAYFGCICLNNKIYSCGGWNGKEYLDETEIFDFQSENWNYGKSLPIKFKNINLSIT